MEAPARSADVRLEKYTQMVAGAAAEMYSSLRRALGSLVVGE